MSIRHIALGLLVTGASVLPSGPESLAIAQAATATRHYSISVQPLGLALSQFAEQSGVDVVFPPELVRGRNSAGLNGSYTPESAITHLLQGTGMVWSRGQFGNFVVRDGGATPGEDAPVAKSLSAAAPESDTGLADIVVTAEKRETNLQRTPIAISVLGADDLKNRQVKSLLDLADGSIPSLRIAPSGPRSSAVLVGIRGIVPFDSNQPSRDQSVGTYVDGVYLGRSQGLGAALLDIERIEVLKGPQGTLFGRNSVGGALNIVSRKPSGEFGLRATAGIRNFDGCNADAHLDLAQMGDLSLKFDGVIARRGGTVDNPMAGEDDFGRYNRWGVHGGALWEPSSDFSLQIDADYSHDVTTPYYIQLLDKNPAAAALAPLVQIQSNRARRADIGVPAQGSVGDTWGVSMHANWALADNLDLRSISSYRSLEQSQFDTSAGAHTGAFRPNANFARDSRASLRQHQYSQEFQLVGSAAELNYVAGLYYYHEAGDDDAWSPSTLRWNADGTAATLIVPVSAGAATPFPDRASTAKADSYAAFGQLTWRPAALNDVASVTVGGRYTHDEKSGRLYKVNGADTNFRFDIESDHFDPMVTLTLDPAAGLHFYGKWSTAYRAGGANSRSLTYRSFGEEKVSTFEAGLKTQFWDRKARVNLAAYSTRYKDIQIDFLAPNFQGTGRTTIETVNAAGTGTIKGIEVDATVAPVRGLTLSASYAYTDVKIPPALNPFNNNVPQQTFVVFTPKHSGSVAVDFEQPLGNLTFNAHLDANASGRAQPQATEATQGDKSFVVNGRLSLGDIPLSSGNLEVALWSRNLFNEEHVYFRARSTFPAIGTIGVFNEPRTYGIEATVRF
jgi:iron complex outermembrane receptor protein